MRVGLTGSSGFLSQNLKNSLKSSGHEVVEISQQEILSDQMSIILSDVEHLLHFGGPSARDYIEDSNSVCSAYTYLSQKLFTSAIQANVKSVFFASTAHVYRVPKAGAPSEFSETGPNTPYARNRLEVEQLMWQLFKDQGTRPVVLRLSNVFGWNPNVQASSWKLFVNDMVRAAITTGSMRINSNSQSTRDFIPVSDLCLSVLRILQDPRQGIWNIGSGEPRTLGSVAESIKTIVQSEFNLMVDVQRPNDDQLPPSAASLDVSKAESAGFLTHDDFATRLKELVALEGHRQGLIPVD